jgi:hypothetical protein
VAAETLLRIAADPKHLGASIGATLVLPVRADRDLSHPADRVVSQGGS